MFEWRAEMWTGSLTQIEIYFSGPGDGNLFSFISEVSVVFIKVKDKGSVRLLVTWDWENNDSQRFD